VSILCLTIGHYARYEVAGSPASIDAPVSDGDVLSDTVCLLSPLWVVLPQWLYGFWEIFTTTGYSVDFHGNDAWITGWNRLHRLKEHNATGLIMSTCWLLYHCSQSVMLSNT